MKFRWIVLLLVLMTLGFGAIAHAQDMSAMLCGGLSADDCNVLTSAFANSSTLTSGSVNFSINVKVDSTDSTQQTDFSINGDGRFSDAKGISMGMPMNMLGASAYPSAMFTEAMSAAAEGIKGFNGDLSLTFAGLPQDAAMMNALNIHLMLVDGVGYIDFGELAKVFGPQMLESMNLPNGWAGLDLVDTFTQGGAMMGGMVSGMMDGSSATVTTPQVDPMQMMQLMPKYIGATRDGNAFTFTIDLAGLLSDPEIQKLMQSGGSEVQLNDKQIAALSEVKPTLTYTITEDGYVGSTKFELSLSEETLQAMQTEGSDEVVPSSVQISLTMNMGDFNQVESIQAPAGAPVAKFADLMQMIGGAMSAPSS